VYTIYIAAAVANAYSLWQWTRRDREDCFSFVMHSICGAVVMAIVVAIVSGFLNARIPSVTVNGGVWNLVAMRSSDGVAGSFVWGTGTIDGRIVYTVYIKNSDGSITPWRIIADANTRIIEDESLHNQGTWRREKEIRDPSSPLVKWAVGSGEARSVSDVITVPKGTVVQSFSIK
jgi:hypothetical protein